MILTLTANPSIDRTATLATPLVRGAVHRVVEVTAQAGGKGVNVSRVAHGAGQPTLAILPSPAGDAYLAPLRATGVPHLLVPSTDPVRTNLTITEPDGTTTKVNEPGGHLDPATLAALTEAVLTHAGQATWVVLSGSLPQGVPAGFYADLVAALRGGTSAKVAVDTSDAPLAALGAALRGGVPDATPALLKPNAEELEQLTGAAAGSLEGAAAAGDFAPAARAARLLVDWGVGAVLTTLGAAGAVLVTADGAWSAAPPPITPVSTVGAGDSSLAGYLLADTHGLAAPQALAWAVAHGSAAAALPGTTLPLPHDVSTAAVSVTPLH